MSHVIREENYLNHKIRIYQDDCPTSPREDDNVVDFIFLHSSYQLGDKHNFKTPEEINEYLQLPQVAFYCQIFMYDHSGLSFSTEPFLCPWDSGMIGYAVITEENKEKLSSKSNLLDIIKVELEQYNQYVNGDVYYFDIIDEWDNYVDGCAGYYGHDSIEDDILPEARSIIELEVKK